MRQIPLFNRDIKRGKAKGLGLSQEKKNAGIFTERVPLSYACCGRSKRQMGTHLLCLLLTQNKERTGKEWNGNEQSKTDILL